MRSRARTSAHSSALSVGASRVIRSRTGSSAATPATLSGHPSTRPLWENSHGPSWNGAAADSVTGMPTVAERTAARTAPEDVAAASNGSDGSLHSGRADRYTTGTGNQPSPKPSALMVPPPRMSRGAHDWWARPCGASNSSRDSGTGGPRYAR
ncbi:hypothetical protein GCM10027610_087530 [Dactylosporangium cerinum]